MSGDEPRRSGRANKGHHKRSPSPAPDGKSGKLTKKGRKAEPENEEDEPQKEEEVQAGDEEDEEEEEGAEVIRCICGDENAKDKRAFIGCDACSVWQHNVCMGMPDDEDEVGEHYFCEQCRPEEHQETLEALEKGEKIWETRNKLYNAEKKKSKGRKSKGDRPSWLKRDIREDGTASEASDVKDAGNKRKRAVKEEADEPEQKSPAEKPNRRQDKRRKAESASLPDPDTAVVAMDKLPTSRQNIAKALAKVLTDDIQSRVKSSSLTLSADQTPASLAEKNAILIEYSLHINHGGPANATYGAQFRALNANLRKNRTLIGELLAGRLSADELSTMSSSDMASEELQEERAKLKAEADRQATIEQVDHGPRYRRTHKGDEIVENEAAASSSAPVARPVRHAETDGGDGTAASPTAISPIADSKDEERRASANFDMQNIWAKTEQTAPRPLQIPARRRSSMHQADGTKVDADVDRLLADDDEIYSPQEFPGDIVWRGKIHSTTGDAAPAVNARWVAGRDISQTIPWRTLLPDTLNIDGRLQIPKAEEYLCGLQWSSSSDVSVLSLTPFDDAAAFNTVFNYFKTRERYAVVNKDKKPLVKDLYIIPVDVGDKLPDHIEMLEYCSIKKPIEERLLLATFVVSRSAEPAVPAQQSTTTQPTNGHRGRILSSQGPAASPLNANGSTFATQSPTQQGYPVGQSPVATYAAPPLSQEDAMRMGFEILGPLYHSPVAQQVLAAPGITRDVVLNMRKILSEDVATQTDFAAFASKLGYGSS